MNKLTAFFQDNKIECCENFPMSKYSSFKIGGPAAFAVFPKTIKEVKASIDFFKEHEIMYIVLGNCSNVLVSDDGIKNPVIFTEKLKDISVDGSILTAGAGNLLSQAANFALDNSLSGLEFAHGIPGSVGGAVYMNAGAYGGNMSDVVISTLYINRSGEIKEVLGDDHCFGYRKSIFKDGDVILSTKFSLEKGSKLDIKEQMVQYMNKRKTSQPLEYPSAGSVFKRPEGYYAGALIEQSGLKGFSVGGAEVSTKHSGFIINKGDATASDVKILIKHIQDKVYEKFGVHLETEVKFI